MTNRYQSTTPRGAMAFAAIALTAVTLGAWVIAPTKTQPGKADTRPILGSHAVMPAPAAAEQGITRIDVIATRHAAPAAATEGVTRIDVAAPRQPAPTVLVREVQPVPKHKQQS
jgi:hypothetical protein